MAIDVAQWLREIGLEQYSPAFAENRVDWEILPKLTGDDLKEMGVLAVGDRRRLLEAIAALATPPQPGPAARAPPFRSARSGAC